MSMLVIFAHRKILLNYDIFINDKLLILFRKTTFCDHSRNVC